MQQNHWIAWAAAALLLAPASAARAAEPAVTNPFFNPFLITAPDAAPSWLSFFTAPSASSRALRPSTPPSTPPPVELPSLTTPAPLQAPVAAAGRPPKELPFRSPYSPPPRAPFGL